MTDLFRMTFILFIAIHCLMIYNCPSVSAQSESQEEATFSRSSLFLGINRGQEFYGTINYDHRFTPYLSVTGSMRGLLSILTGGFLNNVGLQLNYLAGVEKHFLEIGAGVNYRNYWETSLVPTTTIGYRYHPPEGGFLFRFGLTPYYYPGEVAFFEPQLSLSLGYAFRPKDQ